MTVLNPKVKEMRERNRKIIYRINSLTSHKDYQHPKHLKMIQNIMKLMKMVV